MQAFVVMYNFDPSTFSKREEIVKPYLSNDLIQEYFHKKGYVDNANGVSSKAENQDIEVYVKAVQGEKMQGLVKVKAQSKINNTDWKTTLNIFKVTYDTNQEKLTDIQNLGNVYNEETVN